MAGQQPRKGDTGLRSDDKNIEEAELVEDEVSDVKAELIDVEKAEAAKRVAKEGADS